ncbi:DUF924 domain-containing protein [Herbaspirillum lusitanum]|jgi:uncharacterized protein (DUF924 family)|uniref:DUF924 domain-containing protein n=1 Tax=Herbaspirillum lusitanum TaxID=213312 RepID=A0ABW9A5C2_9BURK
MTQAAAASDQVAAILEFWFGADHAQTEAHVIVSRQAAPWWGKNPEVDQDMRVRFGPLLEDAAQNRLADWAEQPQSMLALILLLDQFSRNIHRGTPQSFDYDDMARQYCHLALAMGLDQQVTPIQRVFFYLPLEHSEDADDQQYSLQLFRALAKNAAGADQACFDDFLKFAQRHAVIIERFGRFPHRNQILGRASTPEEVEFLKQPGSSF